MLCIKVRLYSFTKCLFDCSQGRTQGGLGLAPLEFDILQKLYYMRKGDYLFSHKLCLLICRLNANATE